MPRARAGLTLDPQAPLPVPLYVTATPTGRRGLLANSLPLRRRTGSERIASATAAGGSEAAALACPMTDDLVIAAS